MCYSVPSHYLRILNVARKLAWNVTALQYQSAIDSVSAITKLHTSAHDRFLGYPYVLPLQCARTACTEIHVARELKGLVSCRDAAKSTTSRIKCGREVLIPSAYRSPAPMRVLASSMARSMLQVNFDYCTLDPVWFYTLFCEKYTIKASCTSC